MGARSFASDAANCGRGLCLAQRKRKWNWKSIGAGLESGFGIGFGFGFGSGESPVRAKLLRRERARGCNLRKRPDSSWTAIASAARIGVNELGSSVRLRPSGVSVGPFRLAWFRSDERRRRAVVAGSTSNSRLLVSVWFSSMNENDEWSWSRFGS